TSTSAYRQPTRMVIASAGVTSSPSVPNTSTKSSRNGVWRPSTTRATPTTRWISPRLRAAAVWVCAGYRRLGRFALTWPIRWTEKAACACIFPWGLSYEARAAHSFLVAGAAAGTGAAGGPGAGRTVGHQCWWPLGVGAGSRVAGGAVPGAAGRPLGGGKAALGTGWQSRGGDRAPAGLVA